MPNDDDDDAAAMELESALQVLLDLPPLPSESLQENNDDDDGDYMDMGYFDQLQFDLTNSTYDEIVLGQIHEVMTMLGQLARAAELDDVIQYLIDLLGEEAHDGGGAVPASAAVVAGLEKQTFRAATGDQDQEGCGGGCGRGECTICFEGFKDGEEVSVMPCSGGHEFHTECIAKWLGQYSNMCPLCRHALPVTDQQPNRV